jgi:hypothetical protein
MHRWAAALLVAQSRYKRLYPISHPANFAHLGPYLATDRPFGGIAMPLRTGNDGQTPKSTVIDFNEVRAQKLEEKRRTTERIFFKQLLSVYSVIGNSSMCPIEFIDLSEEGCSFQIPYDAKNPWPKDSNDVPLRIYFSQDTYLEIRVKIQNSRPSIENNRRYVRFGCLVDQNTKSYAAYLQFVRFLKTYAEQSHKDTGDVSIFYL